MATKRLILMRHAKSDWQNEALTDFERPLNRRGRHDSPRVGRWFHFNSLHPDVICCSSAARTRETLSLVSTELDISQCEVQFMGQLYHANETEIAKVIDDAFYYCSTVLILGHNPGLEMALLNYCPQLQIPSDRKIMTTACVAVIDFEEEATPGKGRLVHHRRPD